VIAHVLLSFSVLCVSIILCFYEPSQASTVSSVRSNNRTSSKKKDLKEEEELLAADGIARKMTKIKLEDNFKN